MKLANMVGERFKDRPSDCVIDSHAFSVRGGYIKYVANYKALLPFSVFGLNSIPQQVA